MRPCLTCRILQMPTKIKHIYLKEKVFKQIKIFIKNLLISIIFTFVVYSLLLCYAFGIKTPKLFGVILLSLRLAIKHRFEYVK